MDFRTPMDDATLERLQKERYEEEDENNGYMFRLYELDQVFDSYQGHDSAPQPAYDYSSDSCLDSDSDMTDEQLAMHQKEIAETDGFDVKPMPGVRDFGVISPFDLSNEKIMAEIEFFAKMAIDEFNKRFKDSEGELVFDKVIMAMGEAANGIRHYITFDAKNVAQDGKIITYQAIVAGVFEDEVNAFRLKPEPGNVRSFEEIDLLRNNTKRVIWSGDGQLCPSYHNMDLLVHHVYSP